MNSSAAGRLFDVSEHKPNEQELRQSGIEVIGAVPWGTHFCQFYATGQDLIETLVPYFQAGLAANEFCMWVTSAPLKTGQAMAALQAAAPELESYLARGQIEILDYSEWYTLSGRFDADEVLQGWMDKLAEARRQGYEGLRLTGNTFWLEKADWDDFKRYEEKVNSVIGEQRMIALCTYSLEKCGAREVLDVVANHQFALIKTAGNWEIIESAAHAKMEQALRDSEEELRRQKEWLRVTLTSIGDGVIACDANGLVTFLNPVAADLTGWTLQQAVGKPIQQVLYLREETGDGGAGDITMRVLKEKRVISMAMNTVLVAKDGRQIPIEDSAAPILDGAGVLTGAVLVFHDVTETRRAQAALLAYTEQLQISNQALEDFAFIASHDLQEPLRKVQAFGNMLKSDCGEKLDDLGRHYIDRMQQAAGRMQGMLSGLLAYSRVTSQGQPFVQVDLEKIVAEVLSDLEARLMDTGGQVEVDRLPMIEGDPLQIRQLFQNLLGNALKFHRPDTPPQVRVTCQSMPDQRVVISVADDGIGFEPQYADRLFKPFHRLHGKSEYEGSGMGLAICRKIVERHAGEISVESWPNVGTTFRVSLPG